MFEFAWPWLLTLLPLPLLIGLILPKTKPSGHVALNIPFYDAIAKRLSAFGFSGFRTIQVFLAFLIWVLCVFAAARPQWLGEPTDIARTGRSLMLAIDLSRSMHTPDMLLNEEPSDRLTVVKQVASRFIKARTGDRLGLILFGTRAYLQTPLTFDRKTVNQMLDDATIGLAGNQTAIGDAVGLAIKRLIRYPEKNRILILLTDGQSNAGVVTPLSAAELAKKNHVKIYTIGVGADRMLVQGIFGAQAFNPSQDLDIKTLTEIAKLTGGQFFRAKDTTGLKKIYQKLDKLEPVSSATETFRPIHPLYPWPLGFALLFSFILAATFVEWRQI